MEARRRSGFVLAMLLALAFILFVVLFALHQWMIDENVRAHRYQTGEVVSNLALSAAEGAFRFLASELDRPGSPLRRRLIRPEGPPAAMLSPSPAAGLTLAGPDLPDTMAIPEVFRLARDLGISPSGIDLQITFFGFRALERDPLAGIETDPGEIEGFVRVRGEVAQGRVRRAFVGQKEARISNHLAPLFSKFSLVIAAQPAEDVTGVPGLNRMALELPADRAQPELTWDTDGGGRLRAMPVTVVNHPDAPAWRESGGLRRALAPLFQARRDLLDRAGLVYLGTEGVPADWPFNVSTDGFYDRPAVRGTESFSLRAYPYARSIPGVGAAMDELSGFYEPFLSEAPFLGTPRFAIEIPAGRPLTDRVPWLRLSGDESAVSPTVVLGAVSRRYVRYAYLDGPAGPTYLGYYPDEATWRSESPLVASFGGDWTRYAAEMARVVVEPYNRGADFMLTNGERQTGTSPAGYMRIAAGSAAGDPLNPPLVLADRLRGDSPVTSPDAPGTPSGYRLTRASLSRGARRLFSGDVAALLSDPGREAFWPAYVGRLGRKAVRWVRNQGVLFRLYVRADGGADTLRLPGVVRVNEGGLALGPITVTRGGMILVPGDITLRGPITCEPGEVLTIISSRGNVTVANDRPIQASVLSLAGRLTAAAGMDLRGAIGVRSIAVTPTILGDAVRRITYDPRLDPTDAATGPVGEDTYQLRTRYTHEEGTQWAVD